MADSLQQLLVNLRFVVGGLGERKMPKWWDSSFSSKTSEPFLAPIFPRSTRLAQYHALCEAAMPSHDHFIGAGKTYHLFRLPEELEQSLHEHLVQQSADGKQLNLAEDATLEATLNSVSDAVGKASEGPACVGNREALFDPEAWRHVAGLYAAAFSNETKVFPYFKEDA